MPYFLLLILHARYGPKCIPLPHRDVDALAARTSKVTAFGDGAFKEAITVK